MMFRKGLHRGLNVRPGRLCHIVMALTAVLTFTVPALAISVPWTSAASTDIFWSDFNNGTLSTTPFTSSQLTSITGSGLMHSHGSSTVVNGALELNLNGSWTTIASFSTGGSNPPQFNFSTLPSINFSPSTVSGIRLTSSPGQNQSFHGFHNTIFHFNDPTPVLGTTPSDGSTLAFGHVLVGTTNNGNPGQDVTAENTGGGTLTGSFGGVTNGFNPTGSAAFSLSAGDTDTRTYNFSPTTVGSFSDTLSITSDGGNATLNLTGQGVAPILDVPIAVASAASGDAGNVRIGTTGSSQVDIGNIGDGNLSGLGSISNLNGTLGAASGPAFSGPGGTFSLPDGTSTSFTYGFTPTTRGIQTEIVALSLSNGNPSGNNSPFSQGITLQGNAVGPEYESTPAPGSTMDFGDVGVGGMMSQLFQVRNASPDPDFGVLTDLTLLSATITGDPDFSINLVPGTVLSVGQSINLSVTFAPILHGLRTAKLTIRTYQGAAFCQPGAAFKYNLTGIGVPEPSTIILGLAGVTVLLRPRRRGCARTC